MQINSSCKSSIIMSSLHENVLGSAKQAVNSATRNTLVSLASQMGLETDGKKTEVKNRILEELPTKSTTQVVEYFRSSAIGFKYKLKSVHELTVEELVNSGICLPLDTLFNVHPTLTERFTKECSLVNTNNNITSMNCVKKTIQGLYILSISVNGIDYIVKLGSFAQSQGLFMRICSFGGGNYETGSSTNKLFQWFIKKTIDEGHSAKFTYYEHAQLSVSTVDLTGDTIIVIPDVIRHQESTLFRMYNEAGGNISPIFGSNCL